MIKKIATIGLEYYLQEGVVKHGVLSLTDRVSVGHHADGTWSIYAISGADASWTMPEISVNSAKEAHAVVKALLELLANKEV